MLDGELLIDLPQLFPVATEDLKGHEVYVLDTIERGRKVLVEGLEGIRTRFFCFRFEENLCLAYNKSHGCRPAGIHRIDEAQRHTRRQGQHTTVYFTRL